MGGKRHFIPPWLRIFSINCFCGTKGLYAAALYVPSPVVPARFEFSTTTTTIHSTIRQNGHLI